MLTMPRLSRISWAGMMLFAATVQAVYLPSQLPDPSRRWSVSVSVREGYSDNVNATATHREGSSYTTVEPKFYLNLPGDQTFFGLQYTYQMFYYPNRTAPEEVDQNHIFDLLCSHRFTPRLTLDVNDSFRRAISPELANTVNGVPRIERERGDYWYNALSGSLTYSASHRWTLSLAQLWETVSYDKSSIAKDSDHNSFSTSASATYTVDPVSSVGANVRYSFTLQREPGHNDERNSQSEAVFLSYTHLFTPVLGLNLAGGASFNQFGEGQSSVSPYASGSLSYTYLPDCTLSFIAGYSFFDTEVAAYRSSDTFSMSAQLSHRLTPKCRVTLSAAYLLYQYRNRTEQVVANVPTNPMENALRLGLSASYQLTRWLYADLSYGYDQVWSDFQDREYWRNRIDGGLRFTF